MSADKASKPSSVDSACARGTVGFSALARVQRTYRIRVPAGRTLVVRARGEEAGLAIAFDGAVEPDTARTNVGRTRIDSLSVGETREVAVRVMLVPLVKKEPRISRVLVTFVLR